MGHLGITELSIILIIVSFSLVFSVFPVIAFWKICSRVGFNGALGLLMLVPIANIVLPLYVAFSEWPACKNEPEQAAQTE